MTSYKSWKQHCIFIHDRDKQFFQITTEAFPKKDRIFYIVTKREGYIGTGGRKTKSLFSDTDSMKDFFSSSVTRVISKGYREGNLKEMRGTPPPKGAISRFISSFIVPKLKSDPSSKQKKIYPDRWEKIKQSLLPHEIRMYEESENPPVVSRRHLLAHRYRLVYSQTSQSNENLRESWLATWYLLRIINARVLASSGFYDKETTDGIQEDLLEISKGIENLSPDIQKRAQAIEYLFDSNYQTPMKKVEQILSDFIEETKAENRYSETVGEGGINMERIKLLNNSCDNDNDLSKKYG